ncbi:hypothetical protein [Salipaludibacillus sp. CF4.18]|uniref:hypothetical protein n=1 Tax=Salipaludibacillus sp. CF4.18 TaxID=3373081 RepID=UPI003EE695E7
MTILRWAHGKKSLSHYRLVVAFFNDRAIQLYKGMGFKEVDVFTSSVGNTEVPFAAMTLSISDDFLSQQ